ncbi:TRAP transporter small permease [uncultured Sphaerochaeta sp.]|uniref:TRAP transporter small permease n=1 Tax=uncultured Sphaerochaeta sp. TaxID=886478 RepID=UPI0037490B6C
MDNEKINCFCRYLRNGFSFIVFLWVLLVNISIFTRYIFKVAIPWNEELSILLFNWFIFIGTALASINEEHITITLLSDSLHGNAKAIVNIFQNLLLILFVFVVCFQSWKICFLQARTEQFTAILNIPVYFTTLAMSIGSVLWLLILFSKLWILSKQLLARRDK